MITPNKLSIVLIDSDSISNFVSNKVIKAALPSASIVTFTDGKIALEYFEQLPLEALPQIIIMESKLPYEDWKEFMQQYKILMNAKGFPEIFMICLTASMDMKKIFDELQVDVIPKPLLKESVLYMLDKYAHFQNRNSTMASS